jgi:MFS family permease
MRPLAVFRRYAGDLPAAFWVLWAGSLVNRLGTVVLPFLTLYLTTRRGLPPATAALTAGLYGAGGIAATLLGGALADRVGRRATILASLGLGAGVLLLVPAAEPLPLLAAAVLGVGLTGELFRPAVAAAVADLVPDVHRPRAYSLLYWAANLGTSIAAVLGGLLAARSYVALFVVDAATMIAFAAIVAWRLPETRPVEAADGFIGALRPRRLRAALADPTLVAFALLSLPVAALFWQAFTILPLSMAAAGLSATSFGLALSLNGAVIVLVSLPLAAAVARLPRLPLLAAGTLLVGVGMSLHGPAASTAAYAAAIVLWTLGEIVFFALAPSLVADLAPARLRGSYQGVFHAAWGAGAFLGPALGGAAFERWGDTTTWVLGLAAAATAAAGMLALRPAAARAIAAAQAAATAASPPPAA